MFQTMTQIAKAYDLEAKEVGNILYELKIRDPKHPIQKGFPFEQAITHGIAQESTARSGETYYRYDISSIREEFQNRVELLKKKEGAVAQHKGNSQNAGQRQVLEHKLQAMLQTLNEVLSSGEIEKLYRLKADIADIYALSSTKVV